MRRRDVDDLAELPERLRLSIFAITGIRPVEGEQALGLTTSSARRTNDSAT
jgi:hypothetical protein